MHAYQFKLLDLLFQHAGRQLATARRPAPSTTSHRQRRTTHARPLRRAQGEGSRHASDARGRRLQPPAAAAASDWAAWLRCRGPLAAGPPAPAAGPGPTGPARRQRRWLLPPACALHAGGPALPERSDLSLGARPTLTPEPRHARPCCPPPPSAGLPCRPVPPQQAGAPGRRARRCCLRRHVLCACSLVGAYVDGCGCEDRGPAACWAGRPAAAGHGRAGY